MITMAKMVLQWRSLDVRLHPLGAHPRLLDIRSLGVFLSAILLTSSDSSLVTAMHSHLQFQPTKTSLSLVAVVRVSSVSKQLISCLVNLTGMTICSTGDCS